ncbi:MAG: ATP-binding protein [Actinomycetota bacterium]|nr:ATP-binding protein [Actinomycetota bacterium]
MGKRIEPMRVVESALQQKQRGSVRILLSSTRFIASLFWLTIAVATMVFILPYSERTQSPAFYAFVMMSIGIFLANRYFPYEGYHPVAFFLLLLAMNAQVALMVYMTGGSSSSLYLLFLVVIIFSSVYFELLETMLITAVTCAIYFAPVVYESVSFEALKDMAVSVPIFFIIALGGYFVINKAREQEREKQALTDLYDKADTKRRELSTLYAVSLKLASTLDSEEMMAILLDSACELVPNDALAVSLLERPNHLCAKVSKGFDREQLNRLDREDAGNPIYVSASAVLPVILRDTEEDKRFQVYLEEMGFRSMLTVPLYASSSVIGVISSMSKSANAFDDEDARLLLTLASEAALALEKASLYRTTLEDKSKIEAIINSLKDGLIVIDRKASLLMANPYVMNIMGIEKEDFNATLPDLLQRYKDFIEFKGPSYEEALQGVLIKGDSLRNEMVLGTEPPSIYQVFWVPLKDSVGDISGAVILLHDITYFIELDRMKSEFISIVSHELKTPLTSIRGFVRLLDAERVGPITDKQRHYLDIVQKQADSLTKLINDLLDLSKIEQGVIQVSTEAVDLKDVVEEVTQRLNNMACEKEVTLEINVPPDMYEVEGDRERLAQVFMNLIHNAIKFTPPGGKVTVRAAPMDGECMVKVSDNGIGISAHDLPKIFNRFYQVDSSSTRQQSGTGLGLSITKQLINAHGGEMWVTSTEGKGTTFSFTLHFHASAEVSNEKARRLREAASR